jgi:hypothetical protein
MRRSASRRSSFSSFCTSKGKRWDEGNVRERLLDAGARLASEKLVENGLPPLPHVTPHDAPHVRLGHAPGDELRRPVPTKRFWPLSGECPFIGDWL